MPRQPKNFEIAWVSIEPRGEGGYLRTGPDTAVPTRFGASFALVVPNAAVQVEVFVGSDLRPRVMELTLRSNVQTPITTTVLRQVLVDQLLREALSKATVAWADVPKAVREEAVGFAPPADEALRENAEEHARTAARIYSDAVTGGSKAPAMAVAHAMNRSRAQVARYIRKARELGLLPSLDSSPGGAGNQEGTEAR
ncbi:hypothetical protein [Amycolatopsis sp. lyj-84]|uniref:hypothetical protein n=1 Tax=Amycolatopsis sp. lyj-84 TaxID=2789284 RepID=UPI00397A017D